MTHEVGLYDGEYRACSCFWGREPGKLVRFLAPKLHEARVLDLGAGEGKNALFLAGLGHRVVAVEYSKAAIANFERELAESSSQVGARVEIVEEDVRVFVPTGEFDFVVAYGLLHCLESAIEVRQVVASMQKATARRGLHAVVALTDQLPPPPSQPYLHPSPLSPELLDELYSGWEVTLREHTELTETHPTSREVHTHSVARLVAVAP